MRASVDEATQTHFLDEQGGTKLIVASQNQRSPPPALKGLNSWETHSFAFGWNFGSWHRKRDGNADV